MPIPIPANIRALAKRPSFVIAGISIVALGVALATTAAAVIDALIFRPIPVDNLQDVYRAHSSVYGGATTPPDARDLFERTENKIFAYSHRFSVEYEMNPNAGLIVLCELQGEAFEVLGWKAEEGRLFTETDYEPGSEPVTIISYAFWKNELAGRADIIGQSVQLNGKSFRIIGILPEGKDRVHRTIRPAFWTTLTHTFESWVYNNRNLHGQTVLARLAPGESHASFQTQLDLVDEYLQANYTDPTGKHNFEAIPESQAAFEANKEIVSQSYIILGLVAALLLIACFNVGNMLLSNAYRREREFAIRRSLGASPGQIIKQLLSESLFISLLGGCAGLLLSIWLVGLADTLPFTRWVEVRLDSHSVLIAVAATLFTGIASGLLPAYHLARGDAADSLKRGAKGSSVALSTKGLVIAQIALSATLLTSCLLYFGIVRQGLEFDSEYDADKLTHFEVSLQSTPENARPQVAENLRERLLQVPGIAEVSYSSMRPLRGGGSTDIIPLNSTYDSEGAQNLAESMFSSQGFLDTLGIKLLEGRDFRKDEAGWPFKVALVNQTFADRYWPDQGAIGQEFYPWGVQEDDTSRVIGIYKDFPKGPWEDIEPQFMLSLAVSRIIVYVRSEAHPSSITDSLEAILRDPSNDFVARDIRFLSDAQRDALRNERSALIVLGTLAICALFLSSAGIWYTTRQFVRQSRKELSIRLAIGASPISLLKLTLHRSMTLVGIGIVSGGILSFITIRWIRTVLPSGSESTWLPFIAMAIALSTVALIASYLPARTALKADPRDALTEV